MASQARSDTRPNTVPATIVGVAGLWVFLTGGVFVMAYTLPFALVLLVYLTRLVFARPKSFEDLRYQRTLVLVAGSVVVLVDLLLHLTLSGALP